MPEVTISIYSRNYRLAVSSGEEALLQRCAETVDRRMKSLRDSGRFTNQDQVAVLAALELAYDAEKAIESKNAEIDELKTQIEEIRKALETQQTPTISDQDIATEIDKLSQVCEEAIFSDIRRPHVF